MKTGGLREKVYQAAEKWDLWGYGSFGLPRIEMEGDRRVLIEEHGGILEYGPDCIRVAARGLGVWGGWSAGWRLVVCGRWSAGGGWRSAGVGLPGGGW